MESFENNEFENQPAAPESSDAPEAQSTQGTSDTQEPETGCPYAAQARRSSPYANSPYEMPHSGSTPSPENAPRKPHKPKTHHRPIWHSVLAAVLVGFVDPIIRLVSVPEEAVAGAKAYLIICFIGIPCITAYNILASIFRGLGDSKSPMYFIAIACVSNIALDYLFMGALHLGPAGAALGTTLSQLVSVVVSLLVIRKRHSIRVTGTDLKPKKDVLGELLGIGVPVMLQDGFIQVSFMIITIIANHRGLTDAAAVGIVEKIISFLFLVPSSMLSTVSALGAQNIGAGKHDRADAILRYAIGIGVAFGTVMAVLMQFIAPSVVRPFTSDEAVVLAGASYIRGYIFDCLFAGIQFSFSGYFCAYGKSGLSFLHNSLSILLVRVPGAYLASRFFPQTLLPMGLASACGSLFSSVVCVIAYCWLKRQLNRTNEVLHG